MGDKIIAFAKSALLIWLGILIPLGCCSFFMKSTIRKDAFKCVDTFIENENINLTKYIGLQFDNVNHNLQELGAYLEKFDTSEIEEIEKCVSNYNKKHEEINYIRIYDATGKLITSSSRKKTDLQLDEQDLKKAGISYCLEENEDKSIALRLIMPHKIGTQEEIFVQLAIKWTHFEKYMDQVSEGAFTRMFYIISPVCKRYVSLNSLPKGKESLSNLVALGMHLTDKIRSILKGLSTVSVASIDFRIVKNEVKIPSNMHGEKFFFVTAVDDSAVTKLSNDLVNGLPILALILISIILGISLFIAIRLNKTREQLEIANKISNSTPLAIVIFRADNGKIQKANLTASTLLRIQPETIDNINMWNLFISDEDKNYIRNAIDSDITVFNYEVLAQGFGGGTFWTVCSASPIEINSAKYIVLGVLDINRRKEVEKKLANNAEMLEQQIADRTADLERNALELQTANIELERAKAAADTANNAKSVFLTNVSNELKTPLNAIIGYSEILKEEAEDRKDNVTADDLRKIIGAAKHLLSLINEILDLSQIESGKVQLFFENFSIDVLLKDVESVIMPIVTENNNSLFIETAKDIGMMYTDETKLRQCILNLLSNAAKYTEFGKITVRGRIIIKEGEDFVEISVVDTGVGISQDQLATLFEGFQEKNSSNSMGLGLKITKEYAEYLGGTVSAESEIGVGSKFILQIPRICKTTSSDNVLIKNHDTDLEIEEVIKENEQIIEEDQIEEKKLNQLKEEIGSAKK